MICNHETFEVKANVDRQVNEKNDRVAFKIEILVVCKGCMEEFHFSDGDRMGVFDIHPAGETQDQKPRNLFEAQTPGANQK